jgi:hypothetical protein
LGTSLAWEGAPLGLSLPMSATIARARGKALRLCLGDSHTQVLESDVRGQLHETWLAAKVIEGATAFGLANPNSKTNALGAYQAIVRRAPRDVPLLLCLGEVDRGYLAFYRAQERGTDPMSECADALHSYFGFIQQLIDAGHRHIIVSTVSLPGVVDYTHWQGLRNARKQVRASIEERTALTRHYNQQLRDWASAHGCQMLDWEAHITDPATGLVSAKFINPNPADHHLAPAPALRYLFASWPSLASPDLRT